MGDLNHPDTCWVSSTARHTRSRWFLHCAKDNFLMQVVEEPTGRGVLLDPVLTNRDGLVRDVKVRGSLGCSNREMVEFKILGGRSKARSRIAALDFWRTNFDLLQGLPGGIS